VLRNQGGVDFDMAYLEKHIGRFKDEALLVFRVIIGCLFLVHGTQKLGLIDGKAASGLMLFIGISETLIGLGILFGVLTRVAAIGGAIIMAGAIATVHLPESLNPVGKGEAAYLFLAAFLLLIFFSAGKYSLEKAVLDRELV
jgi:putative oxidoreductase